jgi:CRISPR-associated helicase Cas3/CRISPR-associated endonuclease Cas3-HD
MTQRRVYTGDIVGNFLTNAGGERMLGLRQKKEKAEDEIPVTLIPASKTIKEDGGQTVIPGLDVSSHCRLTGLVAHELVNNFPESIRIRLFPKYAFFLAACHDIGKISPAFQKMLYENTTDFKSNTYPELQNVCKELAGRTQQAFHAKVTQAVFENVLSGSTKKSALYIPVIEGMHHGFRPSIAYCSEDADIYGSRQWFTMRHTLLEQLREIFPDCEEYTGAMETWNTACITGGLIIVADWLASGGDFAALTQSDFEKLSEPEIVEMAGQAVRNAGFSKVLVQEHLSFADIFGFGPRQIQSDFYESISGPGVYILEASMGIGKTEAALYAAYKLFESGKATGLYFGLPTQLTSNKIYERVLLFLERITGENRGTVLLKLLHSAAWLENKILGEDADIGKSWFDSDKRGILAPFAVGTVDQALMAVLNVRHNMVRAFGLAGKVVILDEVHSYDAYTGTILNNLIEYLREAQCTVIILSATITSGQKRNILNLPSETVLSESYPLITVHHEQNSQIREIRSSGGEARSIHITMVQKIAPVLETILEKAERGEQVLWIENTVSEAQQIYQRVSARVSGTGIECGLIHSRYIKTQRNINESKWTKLYGKNGQSERSVCGRILVGTQVLEQSLDIDADFMVTRICPTDMLLQRFGRLWRHIQNDSVRPKGSSCAAVLLAPDYVQTLEKDGCFGLSAYVYSEYVLCRTLEIWKDIHTVHLPEDIRALLNKTYSERKETGRINELQQKVQCSKEKLERMARIGLSAEEPTISESVIQTRYSETESISVLLLRSFVPENTGCRIKFCGSDEYVEISKEWQNAEEKRRIAKILLDNCVTVSVRNAPPVEKQIQVFSRYVYLGKGTDRGDEEESPFRAALVGEDGYLRTLMNSRIEIDGKYLLYSDNLGYQVENRKEERS